VSGIAGKQTWLLRSSAKIDAELRQVYGIKSYEREFSQEDQ
jgi:hypothetical protein